ncbi:MAG TPA: flagellar export chaperone FliS [Bacteroidetes bacterium]|nr:flagellar protein FliS [bacterium BMS3Bbin04]HDO65063.1 flagellar export chaperone FliS [Bacteroidota bacterium]HEX04188.1 flagellar export chaperone FliS [Bacteroidota bacterium]
MPQINPYAQYNDVSFSTKSPVGLVVVSYDAAVRGLREAARAMRENDYDSRTRSIDLSFELISELRKSLNPVQGGEIAEKLDLLYEFYQREIVAANASNDPDRLTPVIDMMGTLRDAWEETRKKIQAESDTATYNV